MPKTGKNSNYQTPKREAERLARENEIKRIKRNEIIKTAVLSVTSLLVVASIIVGIIGFNAGWFNPKDKSIKTTHIATMIFGPYGEYENAIVEIELYGEEAPETVANFIKIANAGDYDNSYFYRIIDGFVAQGVRSNDSEVASKTFDTIKGEFAANGFKNNIKHERGVISMARSEYDYDSASYEFFIVLETSENNTKSLDGKYAAFGRVIRNMSYIEEFSAGKNSNSVSSYDVPLVLSVFVETLDKYNERTQYVK